MATRTEALNPTGMPVPATPAPATAQPLAPASAAPAPAAQPPAPQPTTPRDAVETRRAPSDANETTPPTSLRAGVSAPTAPGATTGPRRPVRLDDASATPTQPDLVPRAAAPAPTRRAAAADPALLVALRDPALIANVAATRLWPDLAGLTAAVSASLELARFVRSCTESTQPEWRLLAAGLNATAAAATAPPPSAVGGAGRRLGAAVRVPSAEIRSDVGRGADVPSPSGARPAAAPPGRILAELTPEPAVATTSPLREPKRTA